MTTYYINAIHAARFLNSTLADQSGSDNADVTGWTKANAFVLEVVMYCSNGTGRDPAAAAYRIDWRNVTDSGSFAAVGASGEIAYTSSTDLTNGNQITSIVCSVPSGYSFAQARSEQIEDGQSASLDAAAAECVSLRFGLTAASGHDGDQYEFQIYETTRGTAIGTVTATITMYIAPLSKNDCIDYVNASELTSNGVQTYQLAFDSVGVSESAASFKMMYYHTIWDNAGASEFTAFYSTAKIPTLFDSVNVSEDVTKYSVMYVSKFDNVAASELIPPDTSLVLSDLYGSPTWQGTSNFFAMRLKLDTVEVAGVHAVTSEKNITYDASNMYQGNVIVPNQQITFDSVEFYLTYKAGDISSKTFAVRIWELDGDDNLITHDVVSTGVMGSNSWGGYVGFNFVPDVVLNIGTRYGITIDCGSTADSVNYASAAYGVDTP